MGYQSHICPWTVRLSLWVDQCGDCEAEGCDGSSTAASSLISP